LVRRSVSFANCGVRYDRISRQFAANAAHDAAEETHRRAERRALKAAYNLAAVKPGTDYERFVANLLTAANKALYKATAAYVVSNAAFTVQTRKTARRLGVTLTNHAEIVVSL